MMIQYKKKKRCVHSSSMSNEIFKVINLIHFQTHNLPFEVITYANIIEMLYDKTSTDCYLQLNRQIENEEFFTCD